MNACPPDEPTLQRFIAEIATLPPRPHHSLLLERARALMPACEFRFALTRGGWYRPGGVLRSDGERLTDDLESWAEGEAAAAGDVGEWLESLLGQDLMVTRHAGKTHYFVAPFGPGPADFLQLEVEEVQETLDRYLVNPDAPPYDLAELLEPLAPTPLDAQPVGAPRYRFRRLSDLRQVVLRQPQPEGTPGPLARFLQEWGVREGQERFCDHWLLGLREHVDRFRNAAVSATPVSRHARKLKPFHWEAGSSGLALADQVHAFDRAAGYPGAWYFHMVAGGLVPRDIAYALARDLDAGFSYLPELDTRLLIGWMKAPYAV
ncbi:MAG: hypothetical protein AB1831_12975 [Pseudomonadota bacterium]